jgi:hypothetical protein
MHLDFCTIFNHHYLTRALAMYVSLERNCDSFHVYAYVLDDVCMRFFDTREYPNLTAIPISAAEDAELLKVKEGRTIGEYCWTFTPSLILYSIEKYNLKHCTYIDADLYFYRNPKILIKEMGDNSVLITPHNFSPEYRDALKFGKYCIQFMTFKNDAYAMKALKWWRNACLDWCYNRLEDGKFGDQLYLDDWLTRFEKIHELKQEGTLAPWNNLLFDISSENGEVILINKETSLRSPLVFYHYHGFKFVQEQYHLFNRLLFKRKTIDFGSFTISPSMQKTFYNSYIEHLKSKSTLVKINLDENIDVDGVVVYKRNFENIFKRNTNNV